MSRSAVELDFFRMEKETSAKSQPSKRFDRRRSFRDIQNMVSKLNPELLKNLIASGTVNHGSASKSSEIGNANVWQNSLSVPPTPKLDDSVILPSLPMHTPIFRPDSGNVPEEAPLTIFYNGTVAVFEVPPQKAENILKIAEGASKAAKATSSPADQRQLIETLEGDLPIARRKSLQRFLEKRKERLTMVSPYGRPVDYALSGHIAFEPKD